MTRNICGWSTLCALLLVILSSCSGGSKSEKEMTIGDGPLASLAEKYVQMAVNDDEYDIASQKLNKESDRPALEKLMAEKNERQAQLEASAKTIAASLENFRMNCAVSPATGLENVECHISSVSAGYHSAAITFVFTAKQPITESYGCLFENAKGETVRQQKTIINSEGESSIIYRFSTKDNAETALITSEIASVRLVTDAEY